MSGSDILKASECQVHLGQYYDANKKAIVGGLLDTRMVISFFFFFFFFFLFFSCYQRRRGR
jgi:uncharacterized membrane protein